MTAIETEAIGWTTRHKHQHFHIQRFHISEVLCTMIAALQDIPLAWTLTKTNADGRFYRAFTCKNSCVPAGMALLWYDERGFGTHVDRDDFVIEDHQGQTFVTTIHSLPSYIKRWLATLEKGRLPHTQNR